MKIAITGHRPHKLGNDYDLTSPLIQWIRKQITSIINSYNKGEFTQTYTSNLTFITGMALGIDTLFAKIAIENNIPFIAAIPCKGHSNMWIEKSKKVYFDILQNPLCTTYFVSSDEYNSSCMQNRNIWMVNNCDLLIAVWDGTSGGTANCVKYAKSVNKEIIIINPLTFNNNG